MQIVPRSQWVDLSHRLIHHGRRVQPCRRPAGDECSLASICPIVEQAPARKPSPARSRADWACPRHDKSHLPLRAQVPCEILRITGRTILTDHRETADDHITTSKHFFSASDHLQFRVLPTEDRQGL